MWQYWDSSLPHPPLNITLFYLVHNKYKQKYSYLADTSKISNACFKLQIFLRCLEKWKLFFYTGTVF